MGADLVFPHAPGIPFSTGLLGLPEVANDPEFVAQDQTDVQMPLGDGNSVEEAGHHVDHQRHDYRTE